LKFIDYLNNNAYLIKMIYIVDIKLRADDAFLE
jgi:hypothetical protein